MASSAVALALTLLCMWIGLWSKYKLPRMPKRPVLVLTLLCILLVSAPQPYAGLEIDQAPVVHCSNIPLVYHALQDRFLERPQPT